VALASEPLLLGGRADVAVFNQGRRGVVVVGGDAEDFQRTLPLPNQINLLGISRGLIADDIQVVPHLFEALVHFRFQPIESRI
jgi:hypothetical protein